MGCWIDVTGAANNPPLFLKQSRIPSIAQYMNTIMILMEFCHYNNNYHQLITFIKINEQMGRDRLSQSGLDATVLC